jgi:Uma2 family endonuclease
MTLDEFLAWDGGGHVGKLELVEGRVRAMAPASASHSLIQANIVRRIGNHLSDSGSTCRVATEAPIVPVMGRRKNARAPDVAVTCAPVTDSPTFDDPVLIVEVMSPNNESDTWETIEVLLGLPTMREVLVVWSTRVEAEVFRRDTRGYWPSLGLIERGGAVQLASIDLELPIEALYEGTHLA